MKRILVAAVLWLVLEISVAASQDIPLPATPRLASYPPPSVTAVWEPIPTPVLTPTPQECPALIVNRVASWGEQGNGEGQFNGIGGIAYDAKTDLLFVADTGNHRIQVFRSNGEFMGVFGHIGDGPGALISPTGVAVSQSGNVLIIDSANDRIQILDSLGNYSGEWFAKSPAQIDIGPDDYTFVRLHAQVYTIWAYNALGAVVKDYDSLTDDKGRRIGPMMMAASDANILYVVDNSRFRTIAYDFSGRYLRHWYHRSGGYAGAIADAPGGLVCLLEHDPPYSSSYAVNIYQSNGDYLASVEDVPYLVDLEFYGENPTRMFFTADNQVHVYDLYWGCPLHVPLLLKTYLGG